MLLDGDDEALRRFAREAVGALGAADAVPGRQSFFSYRVLRALSPDTLVAALLDALLAGSDRGGLAEQVARQTIRERLATLRAAIEDEVRRRVAEERGRDAVARTALRPLVDQVDFLRAQQQELAVLRRTVAPLARRLAARLAAKRRHGRKGRLDFRRTVRSSLATGGVPIVTHHRPHRPAQARADRAVRRLGFGRRVQPLHADADRGDARAVQPGPRVRVRRHL